ncbi:MarR family transcriptional regulator [Rhizobium sp. TRM95111]|uniref:MarR family winged helix-turn-helix transcriptional regulator n=1 Tax=Rhizobium alarense TaxID=2846851 RepID=UPI001F26D7F6|nr:MarR family transcriptional regulator [Rhizobium alarense]MCF3642706.1 MarR family transcriptional regulator [Rhizobium alarense]
MEDVMRTLGYLCLGSRMKRLGERLQTDTQRILDTLDASVQAGQHPYLAALDRLDPMTVGDLSLALGLSQPGVTRTVSRLAEAGFVEIRTADGDQRQRIVGLTAAGARLVAEAKRGVWLRIEQAVSAACDDLRGPLLQQLAAIEERLDGEPLDRRAPARKADTP